MSASTTTHDVRETAPVDARLVELTPAAAETLRVHVEESTPGGSRFGWFAIGFVSAVVAGAIGAVTFLALSDADDDGQVELDVPAVDVSVDG